MLIKQNPFLEKQIFQGTGGTKRKKKSKLSNTNFDLFRNKIERALSLKDKLEYKITVFQWSASKQNMLK